MEGQLKDRTVQCNTISKDCSSFGHRTQIDELAEENLPVEYEGVVDLSCLCTYTLHEVLHRLTKSLKEETIKVHRRGYTMSCKRKGVRFEVEVMRLECFRYLRVKKTGGEDEEYKEVISKLLSRFNSGQ
jgi:hypothetical protein